MAKEMEVYQFSNMPPLSPFLFPSCGPILFAMNGSSLFMAIST
jgi:hypothetical protein